MTFKEKFIKAVNYTIKMCGRIPETYALAMIRMYDYVDVPTEEAEDCITFELTCLCEYVADENYKKAYDCAKRIHEVMRDCHMIGSAVKTLRFATETETEQKVIELTMQGCKFRVTGRKQIILF